MEIKIECCNRCKWWQDFNQKVYPRISNAYKNNFYGGMLELRQYRCILAPTVGSFVIVYSDGKYRCGSFVEKEE